ncbi:hypothetical protein BDK51DRAFT_31836 [Blyttiomyces helicus]|uniref:Uncharacterized protein n=1 Tax=Blyttiomyces helicus TaxID=388810 RepID=A0A4P9W6X8_9FUNG|nr:hypothetical protein BDK51DRAFT_31836 [Blyttiomyces helicus]|eukprot:RKO87792.1 hypothetical protein BDK51DRAFT_31836 [Blyttiomyces helicus]
MAVQQTLLHFLQCLFLGFLLQEVISQDGVYVFCITTFYIDEPEVPWHGHKGTNGKGITFGPDHPEPLLVNLHAFFAVFTHRLLKEQLWKDLCFPDRGVKECIGSGSEATLGGEGEASSLKTPISFADEPATLSLPPPMVE